jgi:hypothetical protein
MAALSLVLCVTAAILWGRSYSKWDSFDYGTANSASRTLSLRHLASANGMIGLHNSRWEFAQSGAAEQVEMQWHTGGFSGHSQPPPTINLIWIYEDKFDFWDSSGVAFKHEPSYQTSLNYGWHSSIVGRVTVSHWMLCVPYWVFVLVTTVLPLTAARSYLLRWRQSRNGLCAVCGYDLRATPDHCPECGTVPVKAAEAKA